MGTGDWRRVTGAVVRAFSSVWLRVSRSSPLRRDRRFWNTDRTEATGELSGHGLLRATGGPRFESSGSVIFPLPERVATRRGCRTRVKRKQGRFRPMLRCPPDHGAIRSSPCCSSVCGAPPVLRTAEGDGERDTGDRRSSPLAIRSTRSVVLPRAEAAFCGGPSQM